LCNHKSGIRVIAIVGLCITGCVRSAGTAGEPSFPAVPAACFCEADPNVTTKAGHLGKVHPVPAKQVLVIPVYKNYLQDGTLYLSIAHPFVYKQGDDIEKRLAALGRREHVQKLVFCIPGYFPVHISRMFRLSGDMDGKTAVVTEVQRCIGDEEGKLNSAMKSLLARKSFVVQDMLQRKRPAFSDKPTLTNEPYDFHRLVEAAGYQSRYFKDGWAPDYHLWGTSVGTRIVNEFSDNERKSVATFFDELATATEHSPQGNDKGDRRIY
jgi:hypothetical protein